MNAQCRRRHYRVSYAGKSYQSRIVVNGAEFRVRDVSESGIRLEGVTFSTGKKLAGKVVFADAKSHLVSGTVIRSSRGEAVIEFINQLPLPQIVAEQRRMIARQ